MSLKIQKWIFFSGRCSNGNFLWSFPRNVSYQWSLLFCMSNDQKLTGFIKWKARIRIVGTKCANCRFNAAWNSHLELMVNKIWKAWYPKWIEYLWHFKELLLVKLIFYAMFDVRMYWLYYIYTQVKTKIVTYQSCQTGQTAKIYQYHAQRHDVFLS